MRPRELTLNGFRSYADEVTFDWRDRRLVGIVGPIGSGKSSILDAISFALYGKTPRIERDTKSLINQRRDALQVALTFDVDGETWKAVRAVRRSGASSHVLYRVDDGSDEEVTDKARDMAERIEVLLGLDFDGFRRSVLLAQNQFAAFLEATPTDRNQVLKGVFGFERLDAMRSITKGRLDSIERAMERLVGRRSSADADRKDLEEKRVVLTAAEEREQTLEQLRTPFVEAKETIAATGSTITEVEQRRSRLVELGDRIPAADRVNSIVAAASGGAETVARARSAVAEVAEARRVAAQRRDEALAAAGGRSGLDDAATAVHALAAAQRGLDEAASRMETLVEAEVAAQAAATEVRQRLEVVHSEEEAAEGRRAAAATSVEEARSLLGDIQQAHRAHALRADLVEGEPCPVCDQVVATIPAREAPASIAAAEEALRTAERAHAAAVEAADRVRGEVGEVRAAAATADEGARVAGVAVADQRQLVARAREERDLQRASCVELLGEGDPEVLLAERRAALVEAEEALEVIAAEEESARAAVTEAEAEAQQAAAALQTLRSEIAGVAGAMDLGLEVGESPAAISDAVVAVREAWIGRQQAAEGDLARAQEANRAAHAALTDLLEAAGLGEGDDVVEVITAARTERSAIEAEVQLLEKRLADMDELESQEAEMVASADLLQRLHTDLAPSRFLEFVLDERRRALGSLASEHLETLSAGRYRFDDSGDFLLVDLTAADSIRSPASLSGGETFLASLALALALAEIVAREGGRLDAFFLDEGFGSLDPEHLDLAMSGIERLVTSGPERLVVVVSHVPAMRDRLEDLIVLDRDPMTGTTRIVSGRTPA